ncbi:MAG: hypothetical protein QOE61_4872 [Micromonosporaceae bacterium]|nr:hypothetical protein [Micromonosporaceae bacterium]
MKLVALAHQATDTSAEFGIVGSGDEPIAKWLSKILHHHIMPLDHCEPKPTLPAYPQLGMSGHQPSPTHVRSARADSGRRAHVIMV